MTAAARRRFRPRIKSSSELLRTGLEISRSDWAHALGVNERTILRWEDERVEPTGLAAQVLLGVGRACAAGVTADIIRGRLRQGLAAIVAHGIATYDPIPTREVQ